MLYYSYNININSMVENNGIEPLTSCVQSKRSPSWANSPKMAESTGFEPVVQISLDAPLAGEWVKPLFQLSIWWSRLDLNQQALADDLQSSGVTNFPTTPITPTLGWGIMDSNHWPSANRHSSLWANSSLQLFSTKSYH